VIGLLIILVIWPLAYIATVWAYLAKGRPLAAGATSFLLSLVPMIYGRATTPSDWHDHATMSVYYLPTLVSAFLSLVLVAFGLARVARKASSDRTKAR
jgi:hypothetical protein